MITINLKGGLGNQMFQYATGRSLSLQHKTDLMLNTAYFEDIPRGDVPRRYQLDIFNIDPKIRCNPTISQARKVWQKISSKGLPEQIRIAYAHFLLRKGSSVHLDGYFQRPSYFDTIRDTLLSDLSFTVHVGDETRRIEETLLKVNSVAINVRRTDYLRPDYAKVFGVLDMNYYTKALELIRSKIQDPFFCVFSDDPQWVKENFDIEGALFIGTDTFKDYEQMYLMTKCKHNILANSSFAWWGAWLGVAHEKIVIAPRQWTATRTADELQVLPTNWIQL